MKKTLTTIGIWIAAQLVITLIFMIAAMAQGKDFMSVMAPALLFSDFAVIVILLLIKYCGLKELYKTVPSDIFLISMIFGVCAIFAVDLVSSTVDIPNVLEEQFKEMAKTVTGFLGICIIGNRNRFPGNMHNRTHNGGNHDAPHHPQGDGETHQEHVVGYYNFSRTLFGDTCQPNTGGFRNARRYYSGMALLQNRQPAGTHLPAYAEQHHILYKHEDRYRKRNQHKEYAGNSSVCSIRTDNRTVSCLDQQTL